MAKQNSKSDLQTIPGVGKNIEQHFVRMGIKSVADLKGQDPEDLFIRDCQAAGAPQDHCLLYVYRLAVYFAENEVHEPEKLKWWYWKDKQ